MTNFIVYPAIDLYFGNVVRLNQGKVEQKTIYSNAPWVIAETWIKQGATWLHIVNLNAAFGEITQANEKALMAILHSSQGKLKIQLGGGIHTLEHIENALNLGVEKVIIGSAAINDLSFGLEVLKRFDRERIAFALDVEKNKLLTAGWQSYSDIPIQFLMNTLVDAGAKTFIYTNVMKDGMQTGVDWENAKQLADQFSVSVIASGGVANLDDIEKVRSAGLAGVIVGRALYEGNFTLKEALGVS